MNLTQRQRYANHRSAIQGFSILELLIALGLLGTLLALAWSILGSYRTAQQRGWNQTYRMRLAAAARDLLEQDALHFASRIPLTGQPTANNLFASELDADNLTAPAKFQGSASGFTITTVASIDPLPWLEEVLGGGETKSEVGIADLYRSTDRQPSLAKINPLRQLPSLLPQPIQLRYSIQTNNAENTGLETSNTTNTILVRAVAPLSGSSQSSNASNADGGDNANKSQRVLGLDDLYRQTDPDADTALFGVTTNSLRNLTDAAFRYSDGNRWKNTWDSLWDEGLPRAIELSFDYANNATAANSESTNNSDLSISPSSPSDIGFTNDLAEGEIQRDVRIVVLVTAGQAAAQSAPTSLSSGGTRP